VTGKAPGPPEDFGRYRIDRELGRGGMAYVFLAQDLKHHRPVAIKVLRPELAQALGAERFLREIEIAAGLNHPHILALLDSGEAGGFLYYVMPYVEGETLRDRLSREQQLPVDEALQIATQVAGALSYAHSHDVVHRDIKPENILLAGGEVVVADFGIARAITEAGGERLTSTGIAVGTPAYMSPEQGSAESQLDGRSDIFSLACVLYEMLAGAPPFVGPTVQAIQARRMTDPVPPLRTVRETVPADVEEAIVKALAKVPADRFATASQFAAALADAVRGARAETLTRRWLAWTAGGAVLATIASLALFLHARSSGPHPLDTSLIAVAPFDVHGSSLGAWGEGLVEYLSRSLDGAGAIQTVSPSIFLRRWSGRADPASALALGRRTGAGLVVFGSLVQGGRDSVRLRASLLDAFSGRSLGEVEVRGDTLSIDRVADSLAVSLLRELGHHRPVGSVRNLPFGAASLPALKEFLQGERFYRRSLYDSALVHHARAVALDSSFALAYRRMSLEVGWNPSTSGVFEPGDRYAFKAAALNHGLALRDSLLIAADSLFNAEVPESASFALRHRVFLTLNEAVSRFPGDPEAWQALGEARAHLDPFRIPSSILQAFDSAIALDSGFTPAYEHVLQYAVPLGDVDLARRYARAILTWNVQDPTLKLTAQLLDPTQSTSEAMTQLIDSVAVTPLFMAALYLGDWADSGETAVRLFRALPVGRRSLGGRYAWFADTLVWRRYLASDLLIRGHLREAYRVFPDPLFRDPLLDLALLNAVPAETVAAAIARSPALDARSWHRWLPWWLVRKDTAALARAVEQANRVARLSKSTLVRARARSWQSAAAGYLALTLGDSAAAIRDLRSMPDSLCECAVQKLTLAQLLEARREDREAGELIDRWHWWAGGAFFVLARLERARIAERAGDRELATRWYGYVTDVWHNADPELKGYVAEARAGLRRLGAEPRR
jgi:hypothetical protein